MYIYIYNHHRFKGGRTQNVSYIFQGVFEGGLENASLHFEGILKTLPTKTTPVGRSATNFIFKGGVPKNVSYILDHFGVVPPLKSSLKGVVIVYIYIRIYIGTTGGLFVCRPKPILEPISNILETKYFYLGNYIRKFWKLYWEICPVAVSVM